MRAAILIATYNESGNIEPLLAKIFGVAQAIGHEITAVVIDDHSPDGARKVVDRLKATAYGEKLHVLHRKEKAGPDTARRMGFRYCLSLPVECVVEMDGDGSRDPD